MGVPNFSGACSVFWLFYNIGGAGVVAGGFVVASGEFVLLVLGEAFLGEVFIVEGALVGLFGVTGVEGGAGEHFADGFSGVGMLGEGRVGHGLNDLKAGAGAAVGQDFLVGVGGHGEALKVV